MAFPRVSTRDALLMLVLLAGLWAIGFSQAVTRDSLLGRTVEQQADVISLDRVPHRCYHANEAGWQVSLRWNGGEGSYVDCTDHPRQVGETKDVWVSPNHHDFTQNSPWSDRFLWLVLIPAVPVLFIMVLPRLMLPVIRGIGGRIRRRRAR